MAKSKFRKSAAKLWARWRVVVLRTALALGVLGAAAGVGLYMLPDIIASLAPKVDVSRDLYALNRPAAFTFLDSQGREVGHRGAVVGTRLTLDEMPAYLPAAFIAMEDRRFYDHRGFDLKGLLRAAWVNWRAGHVVQGGSTITQQLAKILFLTSDRTYTRKLHEMMDAAALEKQLSKTQILELYLNRIYLGSGAYGVDGAARVYFGKSARDLSLSQAAMLATLTRAPSAFSPRRDLAAAQARSRQVLAAMVKTRAITPAEAKAAKAAPAPIIDRTRAEARNYFLDAAVDEVKKVATIGGRLPGEDLIVRTTLEPRLQDAARLVLLRHLKKDGKRLRVAQGAIVVMRPDGAVTAMIGGRDYGDSVFNRATRARRQPGSAFKPFVYLAAVENGISPWDVRTDGPVDIGGWQPTNYGAREYGTVTLASALAHSVNTITASLAQEVGLRTVISVARRVGITSPLVANASLALGTSEVTPLELTAAYATFAAGGIKATPYLVTEVSDRRGRIYYNRSAGAGLRVIPVEANKDLTAMLAGVVTGGTGTRARLPDHEAAGKTGTTQDYRDAWFVGFTTDYATGVWVGNDDTKPMRNVTGGTLPAAIWKEVMVFAEKGMPAKALEKSEPPVIEDEWDSAYAGSDSAPGYQGGAAVDEERSAPPRRERRGRSFLDWLFGPSEDEPPPPPQQRARDGDRRFDGGPPVVDDEGR
ncbi:MAG TPA: PBP1A family penicillin-binding protein [Rhizomicrobium sp.]|nr:PBP1A family penicillin-binding protein [Rhizomicrobium sp.]